MRLRASSFRRAVLAVSVFLAVAAFHFVWLGVFPEMDPVQSRWVAVDTTPPASWVERYIETQSYYLGFSYALVLGFASVALRRYREERLCTTRNLAIGGISFSGVLAVAGCYLLGCCGSPMLAVYLSLFGASFLPMAKPLVAALTALMIGLSWWWMTRSRQAPHVDVASQSP